MYVYIYIYTHVYVYIYIYIYRRPDGPQQPPHNNPSPGRAPRPFPDSRALVAVTPLPGAKTDNAKYSFICMYICMYVCVYVCVYIYICIYKQQSIPRASSATPRAAPRAWASRCSRRRSGISRMRFSPLYESLRHYSRNCWFNSSCMFASSNSGTLAAYFKLV